MPGCVHNHWEEFPGRLDLTNAAVPTRPSWQHLIFVSAGEDGKLRCVPRQSSPTRPREQISHTERALYDSSPDLCIGVQARWRPRKRAYSSQALFPVGQQGLNGLITLYLAGGNPQELPQTGLLFGQTHLSLSS